MVHPDPLTIAHERGVSRELTVDVLTRPWPVPPGAHRDQHISRIEARAVDEDARALRSDEPRRRTLVVLVLGVEIVVARARDDGRLARDAREVLEDHGDLCIGLDDRRDVEKVARHDDELVLTGDGHDPVELPQRVMQIRHHQDPHGP